MARRARFAALLAVASLAAGAVGLVVHRPRGPARAREGDPAAAAAPGSAGSRRGCRFQRGDALGYAITIDTDGTVDPQRAGLGAAGGQGPVAVHTQVRAQLQLLALTAGTDGAVLLGAYRHLKSDGDAPNLANPFLIRVDPTCHIAAFARFDKTQAAYGRTQQAIVHELLWRWPSGHTVEEPDQNGVGAYVARHAVMGGANGPQIGRAVLSYTALWNAGLAPGGAAPVMPALPATSALVVTPGDGPWFESLRGEEVLAGVSAADARTAVAARRIPPEAGALDGAARDQKRYVWENLLPRSLTVRATPEVTARELRRREEMRALTLDQVLAAFLDRVKTGKDFAASWPDLKTYLEARPEMARELMRRLRANKLPAEAEAAAFLALGKALTPEAREVLLQTMRDRAADVIDRSRSVFAVVDRPDVGADVAREMATNAMAITSGGSRAERIFARESALGVGMMAGLRGDTEPGIKSAAMDAVPGLLSQGTTATALSPAFGAIGNIGNPATLAYVAPYTANSDAGVRAVAARSLRRMSPQETGDFAGEWLARETDATVKRELYTTISRQTYDAQQPAAAGVVQQAINDLQRNPDLLTRKAIINILGPQAATDPTAKAALMKQIPYETQQNSGLYSVIAGYLAPGDIAAAVGL